MQAFSALAVLTKFRSVCIYVCIDTPCYKILGEYFSDCAVKAPTKLACDEELAEQLWVKSVQWTGL